MRAAKRRVLVYCADEACGRDMVFVLNLRGFLVHWADAESLAAQLRVNQFDAALVLDSGERDHAERAVVAIRQAQRDLPVVLRPARMLQLQTQATRVLPFHAGRVDLVDALLSACSRRKPGPKPVLNVAAANLEAVPA